MADLLDDKSSNLTTPSNSQRREAEEQRQRLDSRWWRREWGGWYQNRRALQCRNEERNSFAEETSTGSFAKHVGAIGWARLGCLSWMRGRRRPRAQNSKNSFGASGTSLRHNRLSLFSPPDHGNHTFFGRVYLATCSKLRARITFRESLNASR